MKGQDWDAITTGLRKANELLEEFIAQQTAKGGTRRSLSDEIRSISRSARATSELTASGAGPARFHDELRRLNRAYDTYVQDTEEGQQYSDACAAAGAKMRGEDYEKILKRCRGGR